MKRLLVVTGVLEAGGGTGLMAWPSAAATLLVGTPLTAPAVSLVRVGAAGILALGVACWLARRDAQSTAASGLVAALLLYNVGGLVVLGAAAIQLGPGRVALWLAVVLHAVMAAWCIACLLRRPPRL